MSQTKSPPQKISPLFLVIILAMLVLSAAALYQAIFLYLGNQDISVVFNFLMLGVLGAGLSSYLLFQRRRRMLKLTLKIPRIATTILCQKCGFKTIRDFQRGDYVFKEAEACPKCKEKMLIASIYREVEEKRKKEERMLS